MKSLHQQVKEKAQNGQVRLEQLKPNSRMVAQRMIANGELIKSACGLGWIWGEVRR